MPRPSGLLVANDAPVTLAFHDVDVAYGQLQVLFGTTLEVRRGETVALLGTNGAGKSTMLRIRPGLLAPYRGRVCSKASTSAASHRTRSPRSGLADVPGGRSVFGSLSVADNLRMGVWLRRRDRAAVHAATERVLDLFPSLRGRLDVPAAALSGGQQQMLTIAMSLLVDPKILLIDELSLGLSPLLVSQLLQVVRRLHDEGVTVVVVEQSVNTALQTADRAYFLEKGTIRFHGLTSDLLDRPDLLRSIFLEGAASERPVAPVPPAATDEPPKARSVSLTIEATSKTFVGVMALDDVTIELRDGEILGLIGPNGAGKTTLFDLVSGFLVPDHGRILLGSHDLAGLSPPARARPGLARSFQNARLFGTLTVHQTLCVALDDQLALWDPVAAALHAPFIARSERRLSDRADELIDLMGLGAFRDKFVAELSTGSRRVVDLACQIGAQPTVILLDEPSAGIAATRTEALAPRC